MIFYSFFVFLFLDINECQLGTDRCSHECRDTDGSYECDCPAGMKLDTDQRTCLGTFILTVSITQPQNLKVMFNILVFPYVFWHSWCNFKDIYLTFAFIAN